MRYLLFTLLAVFICTFANAQSGTQIPNTPIYYTSDYVGIGATSPETLLHIENIDVGVKSQHGIALFESIDAHLDIISNSGGTWGSGINLIEGNGASNTNMWSIIRQTSGGEGNSSLNFNFGYNNNGTSNNKIISFNSSGKVGISIDPIGSLDIAGFTYLRGAPGHSITSEQLRIGRSDNNIRYHSIFSQHAGNPDQNFIQIKVHNGNNSILTDQIAVMTLNGLGNVGIGVTNPSEKLVVDGTICATEVKVSSVPCSDYVFEPDYNLLPITEVETFIKENKHLPEIPSAEEFKKNGVGLGEMDDMLLRKVEELTLYVIELSKNNEKLNNRVNELEEENSAQSEEIKNLTTKLNSK